LTGDRDAKVIGDKIERMALRKEDKEWIVEQIAGAVDSLKPKGWRKAVSALREIGPLATIIAIFVTMLGITAGAIYQSFAHVEKETQFRTQTTDTLNRTVERLTSIEGTLSLLQAQIAAQKYSTVRPKDLKNYRDELTGIKNNLVQAQPVGPAYWPTAFEIIRLLSQATSDIEVEKVAEQREGIIDNVGSNPPGGFGPIRNGRVVLKNLVQGVTFINSIVRFDSTVRLANDVFINCVFIFPPGENPPKPLQEIGKTLLASDLSRVTLNAS